MEQLIAGYLVGLGAVLVTGGAWVRRRRREARRKWAGRRPATHGRFV